MTQRQVTIADVVLAAVKQGAAALRVSVPGKIVSFDSETQTATVQPLLKDVYEVDGERVTLEAPLVEDVPVQFPGGGGFVVTFPVQAGDPCWLIVSDKALDVWHKNPGQVVDPVDDRMHDISDCCAILGVRSRHAALAEFESGNARFGKVGGPGISARSGTVHIGVTENESATESAILGDSLKAKLDALASALITHTHSGVTTGPGVSGPSAASWPSFNGILSSKVKIK